MSLTGGHYREPKGDGRTDIEYLADVLAEAIREGFRDLGDRIGAGERPDGAENLALSLKMIADSLESLTPDQ